MAHTERYGVKPHPTEKPFVRNDDGEKIIVTNMGVEHVVVDPLPEELGLAIIYSAIQHYYETPGETRLHREPKGVDEIYYPLSGKAIAYNNGESTLLEGQLNLKERRYKYEIGFDEKLDPQLIVTDEDDQEAAPVMINGVIIKGGDEHGSESIQGEEASFLAIKLQRPQPQQ